MKHFLPILWWLGSIPVIAFVIASLSYPFAQSCALAVMFLPGMLCARYFIPQLSFAERQKGIFDCTVLIFAVLTMEYLCIMLANAYISETGSEQIPPLLLNPFFILLVLTAFIAPEMALEKYIAARYPYDDTIRFISDRRKVTLDPAHILYIESNDSEVRIYTVQGESYRTKTRISQWEGQLDRRFLRVHRSYIVNIVQITEHSAARIVIGDRTIEISRKYKDEVRRRLAPEQDPVPE